MEKKKKGINIMKMTDDIIKVIMWINKATNHNMVIVCFGVF